MLEYSTFVDGFAMKLEVFYVWAILILLISLKALSLYFRIKLV